MRAYGIVNDFMSDVIIFIVYNYYYYYFGHTPSYLYRTADYSARCVGTVLAKIVSSVPSTYKVSKIKQTERRKIIHHDDLIEKCV